MLSEAKSPLLLALSPPHDLERHNSSESGQREVALQIHLVARSSTISALIQGTNFEFGGKIE